MATAALLRCAALPSLSCVSCGPIDGERTSVVLITVDTLRADHVGVLGAEAGRTPALDRFARDATVYENAVAVMPLTLFAWRSGSFGVHLEADRGERIAS
jgi:hypothetical protein